MSARVLVTGATGTIGSAIARAFVQHGVAAIGVHHQGAASVERAEALRESLGPTAVRVPFDLRNPSEISNGIDTFVRVAGGLDVLVCNAATFKPGLLVSTDEPTLADIVAVDLMGPMLCARAALPAMLRQRKGVILMVSSVASQRPNRGQSAYAAAKAGVEGLVRALAVEYARKGVRVVGVRPGPVDSPMMTGALALAGDEVKARVPMARLVSADEVARVVRSLASDDASAITGAIVDVDCGYVLG
ncbi:MAG: SDR family oxidoreductase [Myxococcales bacterium]|nr:SDR family oxidoreductase [Myxococcales bacterium]